MLQQERKEPKKKHIERFYKIEWYTGTEYIYIYLTLPYVPGLWFTYAPWFSDLQ
jgi:hypothetical protein